MAIGFGIACPKPTTSDRLEHHRLAKRARDRAASDFRRAVWKRDQGICQACRRRVYPMLEFAPDKGEVHHRLTRGAHPDQRYDVANGVLLCVGCHDKAQRHEIKL
jgi:5-methylcytosine-specific restriction endonuclease McrA